MIYLTAPEYRHSVKVSAGDKLGFLLLAPLMALACADTLHTEVPDMAAHRPAVGAISLKKCVAYCCDAFGYEQRGCCVKRIGTCRTNWQIASLMLQRISCSTTAIQCETTSAHINSPCMRRTIRGVANPRTSALASLFAPDLLLAVHYVDSRRIVYCACGKEGAGRAGAVLREQDQVERNVGGGRTKRTPITRYSPSGRHNS